MRAINRRGRPGSRLKYRRCSFFVRVAFLWAIALMLNAGNALWLLVDSSLGHSSWNERSL
jgi:hypothetical protein